jgi:hypothetical protein
MVLIVTAVLRNFLVNLLIVVQSIPFPFVKKYVRLFYK